MKNFFSNLFKLRWKILHYAIIVLFLYQIIYTVITFCNVVPPGWAPTMSLWQRATEVPDAILYKRRMYAIELWITAVGLIVYLAIVYKDKFNAKISGLVQKPAKEVQNELENKD